jgi:hypothetical protein
MDWQLKFTGAQDGQRDQHVAFFGGVDPIAGPICGRFCLHGTVKGGLQADDRQVEVNPKLVNGGLILG